VTQELQECVAISYLPSVSRRLVAHAKNISMNQRGLPEPSILYRMRFSNKSYTTRSQESQLTIESLKSSWLSRTCTSEASGGHTKREALLSSSGPILASVSPLDPKSSSEASSRFRTPARPLHTQCVSLYLSILHCARPPYHAHT